MNRLALILIALFGGLYLTQMSRTLQYDEAFTIMSYTSSPFTALVGYTTPNNHLLHSFLVWLSRSLLGDSPLALRLPAFLAALAALRMVYVYTAWVSTEPIGITALVILGTTIGMAEYATNARGYSLSITLTLVVLYLLSTTEHQNWLAVTSMALILTLPSMVFFLLPIWLWLLTMHASEFRWKQAGLMAVGILAGGMFYLPALARGWAGNSLSQFGLTVEYAVQEWAGLIFGTPVHTVLYILAILGAVWMARSRQAAHLVVLMLAGVLILAVGQQTIMGKTFYGRNFVYLVGPLASMSALTLWRLGGTRLLLVGAALCLMLGIPSFTRLTEPTWIDETLNDLKTLEIGGDDILLANCCTDAALAYYYPNQYYSEARLLTAKRAIVVIQLRTLEDEIGRIPEPIWNCKQTFKRTFHEIYVCEIRR